MNRSVPIYPENEIVLKPNEQELVKVKAPFVDEISGMAIIKVKIHVQQGCTRHIKQRETYYDI